MYYYFYKGNLDWPVSVAEVASWGDTVVHYVLAEPLAFGPVVDLADACDGRRGMGEDLAHRSYPQALLVAAAYWWVLEAGKITQIND